MDLHISCRGNLQYVVFCVRPLSPSMIFLRIILIVVCIRATQGNTRFGQEAEGGERKGGQEPVLWFPCGGRGGAGWTGWGSTLVNNFSGPWPSGHDLGRWMVALGVRAPLRGFLWAWALGQSVCTWRELFLRWVLTPSGSWLFLGAGAGQSFMSARPQTSEHQKYRVKRHGKHSWSVAEVLIYLDQAVIFKAAYATERLTWWLSISILSLK